MSSIIRFITSHSLWFYILSAVAFGVLFAIWLRAQQSKQEALFGLELEMAAVRKKRAVRFMLLPLAVIVFVLFSSYYLVDRLPASTRPRATPTVDIFSSPPPTFTNITPTATVTLTPTLAIPTVTPAFSDVQTTDQTGDADETETPTPTPPNLPTVAPGAVCEIVEPADGSEVSGDVTFIGSASVDNFMFYKLEAFGPETGGNWASIIGDVSSTPVLNGVLGTANFNGWAPGGYSVRVVVVDDTSNEVAGCFVSITLTSQ